MNMQESLQTYLIKGYGVAIICDKHNVQAWVDMILDKGGTPIVKLYGQEF